MDYLKDWTDEKIAQACVDSNNRVVAEMARRMGNLIDAVNDYERVLKDMKNTINEVL